MPRNHDEPAADNLAPDLDLEPDSRFPSGPWTGFFLQPGRTTRSWMEILLTFRKGEIHAEGRDWVGSFLFRGRYEVETGKCWWSKQYIGRHSIHYQGFNEGKGIWGVWEWLPDKTHRGGFHIWPVAMGDPTQERLAESIETPAPVEDTEVLEVAGVGAGPESTPASGV
jgi:hypothetical protein